jgi:hypothetical protein
MSDKLEHGKDFEVVWWDWKAECPWQDCVELGRKFQHYYPVDLGNDSYHVLFSNAQMESIDAAKRLVEDYFSSITD